MGRFFVYLCEKVKSMDNNKHNLEDPAASYGRKMKLSEVEFQPMNNMKETLRQQGCITFDEFVDKLSKYL